MHHTRLICLVLLLALPSIGHSETFDTLADRAKPGVLGVAECDLGSRVIQGVNLDRPFSLQSVFKMFLAATVLSKVDAGTLSLNKTVSIASTDVRDGSGSIDNSEGGTFSVRDLLRAALVESDNSAADTLLPLVGGPAGVTAWLREKQIEGIRVDRNERTIDRDLNGVPADLYPGKNAASLLGHVTPSMRHAAFEAALVEQRDTATPRATIQFLLALNDGQLLAPGTTKMLIGIMRKAMTGSDRLRAGFPEHTLLAHKTGTSGTHEEITLATNDAGLATLPDGRTVAIAVFLVNSPASNDTRAGLIAACARVAAK